MPLEVLSSREESQVAICSVPEEWEVYISYTSNAGGTAGYRAVSARPECYAWGGLFVCLWFIKKGTNYDRRRNAAIIFELLCGAGTCHYSLGPARAGK